MPIGVVSDSDFEAELANISGPLSRPVPKIEIEPRAEIVIPDKPGRKEGDRNVPESLRKIIGETSVLEGRSEAVGLASMFNISPSSVSAYAKGATSTASYDTPKPTIAEHIKKARNRSVKKAHRVLSSALESLTPDKLESVKARDLAGIAKDMSAVIKNLEPNEQTDRADEKTPQFVVFAPQFIKEENFISLEVDE